MKSAMKSSSSTSARRFRCRCKCGEVAVVKTTRKEPNAGKRFLGCPFYDKELGHRGCGYFKWFQDVCDEGEAESAGLDVVELATELERVSESNVELQDYCEKLTADNTKLQSLVEKVNEENKDWKKKAVGWSEKKKKVKVRVGEIVDSVEREKKVWQTVALLAIALLAIVICKKF